MPQIKHHTALPEYKQWLLDLKRKIRSTQIKASLAVNATLIKFYWELGKMIDEKQTAWGSKFIEQLSNDLKAEFPLMEGLSFTNLKYCRRFYQFYGVSISQQLVDQLSGLEQKVIIDMVTRVPWGHNILIFTKSEKSNVQPWLSAQAISIDLK